MKTINKFLTILAIIISAGNIYSQVTNPNNNWSSGAFVGWSTTNTIDFKNSALEMQLLTGGQGLKLNVSTAGFWIGSDRVLWHNGDVSNIYVGVGAGNGATAAIENTFV